MHVASRRMVVIRIDRCTQDGVLERTVILQDITDGVGRASKDHAVNLHHVVILIAHKLLSVGQDLHVDHTRGGLHVHLLRKPREYVAHSFTSIFPRNARRDVAVVGVLLRRPVECTPVILVRDQRNLRLDQRTEHRREGAQLVYKEGGSVHGREDDVPPLLAAPDHPEAVVERVGIERIEHTEPRVVGIHRWHVVPLPGHPRACEEVGGRAHKPLHHIVTSEVLGKPFTERTVWSGGVGSPEGALATLDLGIEKPRERHRYSLNANSVEQSGVILVEDRWPRRHRHARFHCVVFERTILVPVPVERTCVTAALLPRLEYRNLEARLRQVPRRANARDATADHNHAGALRGTLGAPRVARDSDRKDRCDSAAEGWEHPPYHSNKRTHGQPGRQRGGD
mmetsp:Transcript_60629/g.166467  ORF Transcript_60629/g.166467 Transcript_60629/m.166467 type:complete len:396 (-) Transcript_60629:1183-2370(-)